MYTKEEFVRLTISRGIIPQRRRSVAEAFANRCGLEEFSEAHIIAFTRSLERHVISSPDKKCYSYGYNSVAAENDPTGRNPKGDSVNTELNNLYKMFEKRKLRKTEAAYTRDEQGHLQLNKDRLRLKR